MFSIGELVVHPMHGAGIIDNIVQERIAGQVKDYYVFKMPVGGLIFEDSCFSSHVIGIRGIISRAEAEALLSAIPDLTVDFNANWSKRYQENLMRMKSGDLYEVARVVKALMHRDHIRGLSTGERKMLHTARQIMLSEMVLAEECEYHEVELRLDQAMMQQSAV